MRSKLFFLATAATCVATPAFAQENADISGFRVEVISGLDRVSTGADDTSDFDQNDDGLIYGAGLGYDFDLGGYTVGIEAEIAEATTGVSESYVGDLDGYDVDGTLALDASEDIYVGARLGMRINRWAQVYAKGGYTMASAELSAIGTVDGTAYDEVIDTDLEGFRVGAGLEGNVSGNFYGKLEYRYSAYSGISGEYDGVSGDFDELFDVIDVNRHQVAVGLGYRF